MNRLEAEWRKEDLERINGVKDDIKHMQQRYHYRMKRKEFRMADLINMILKSLKIELAELEKEFKQYGNQVYKTSFTRGKRVLTVKR